MSVQSVPAEWSEIEGRIGDSIDAMELPESAFNQAVQIYKLSYNNDLYRGRSIEAILGASVYAASLLIKEPRTPAVVSRYFDIEETELYGTLRHFKKNLQLPIPVVQPNAYVDQIEDELSISETVSLRAKDIIDQTRELNYTSGKAATGLAAAAVYIAASEHEESVTQRELEEVLGVSTVTIRNRYQDQVALLEDDDD